jgi:hypothetical protein
LDRILIGIHEEFLLTQKSWKKTIPEKPSGFSRKKGYYGLALLENMVGILFPNHGEHCAGKKCFLYE